jgi:hypothetical protein
VHEAANQELIDWKRHAAELKAIEGHLEQLEEQD